MNALVAQQQKSMALAQTVKITCLQNKPNIEGAYCVHLTFEQLYKLQSLEPTLRGQFEWWTHRDYADLEIGDCADTCKLFTWFVEQTKYDGSILYVSPRLDIPEKAHNIEPPKPSLQRNALRVEIIPPQPRCNLLPTTDTAKWVLLNRPYHIENFWGHFGYCIRPSCEYCPIAHYHWAA